ncbi:MAG: helix-turn-helix domain-containing protein [Gemmatimonadaceae bacterium]|nr:helix-turn-helix domain-containing protein [Gemmatimonadaceae bacterium]
MSVTLLLGGSLREHVGREDVVAHPLSLVVKPVDVEHANTFGADGVRTVQIVLEADEARSLIVANPALANWQWTHAGAATSAFLALASAIRRNDAVAIEQRTFEALAIAGALGGSRRDAPEWITRIRDHILDEPHLTTLSELARDAGVHPVYLARVFRECYGLSVTDFRKRCRVQRVAQQLGETTERSLSVIAHDAGYADHSHMCREFRSVAGLAPSTFRSIVIA